jgi:hypothetical protein
MKALASMWPRTTELLLAGWLALAPWLVGAPVALRLHDAFVAAIVLAVAVWSMAQPQRLVNLWNLATGAWLVLFGLLVSRSIHSPAAQSELLTGIALFMFAIVPSQTMQLPAAWQRFFTSHRQVAEEERRAIAREIGSQLPER